MAVCTTLVGFIETNVLGLAGLIAVMTTMIIAISYMLGNLLSNPKLTLWSKTEIVQLVISLASVFLILAAINAFCAISPYSIYQLTELPMSSARYLSQSGDMFDGAQQYLTSAAAYTHTILEIERYHLMAYDFLSMRSVWDCGGLLDCWAGTWVGGSVGTSAHTYAWAPYFASGFNLAFNSTLMSYLSTLNYLFILEYVNSGFVLFFLPLGIFFRAMPYLRKLGSLFISVSFAFMIVYPLILTSFWLTAGFIFDYIDEGILVYSDESKLTGFGFSDAFASSVSSESYIDGYIFPDGRMEGVALQLAGRALLAGIFLPSLALLATIASISAVSRELGEEINLSRIVQMV